jgi:Uma2 family endonuclease
MPEMWIVDVDNQTVEQYTQPSNGRYHTLHLIEYGEVVQARTIANLSLVVQYIFG